MRNTPTPRRGRLDGFDALLARQERDEDAAAKRADWDALLDLFDLHDAELAETIAAVERGSRYRCGVR